MAKNFQNATTYRSTDTITSQEDRGIINFLLDLLPAGLIGQRKKRLNSFKHHKHYRVSCQAINGQVVKGLSVRSKKVNGEAVVPQFDQKELNLRSYRSDIPEIKSLAKEWGTVFAVYANGSRVGFARTQKEAMELAKGAHTKNPHAHLLFQKYPQEVVEYSDVDIDDFVVIKR